MTMKLAEMQEELNHFEQEGRLRKIETKPNHMTNFSSNDYLGLTGQLPLRKKFYEEYPYLPLSSSSSRLIDGSYPIVMELEKKIEEIYAKPALCFNSGFDANSSVIETIFSKKSLILRSEEHTSELQSRQYLVCRLLLEKKNKHMYHI